MLLDLFAGLLSQIRVREESFEVGEYFACWVVIHAILILINDVRQPTDIRHELTYECSSLHRAEFELHSSLSEGDGIVLAIINRNVVEVDITRGSLLNGSQVV